MAELSAGTAEWIARCQTYEGGIGATPGEEAHGGYTFCGLAAMVLLGRAQTLRLPQARPTHHRSPPAGPCPAGSRATERRGRALGS